MTMNKQVTITKIGDGFGFGAITGEGQGVYIPGSLIAAMGWTESDARTSHVMILEDNKTDQNGRTPFYASGIAPNGAKQEQEAAPDDQALLDEVRYWKLAALRPWGEGVFEAVRIGVAPYGDPDSDPAPHAVIIAELERLGYGAAIVAPAIDALIYSGLLGKIGTEYTATAHGLALIEAKIKDAG